MRVDEGRTRSVSAAFRFCPSCGGARAGRGDPLTCECGFRYYFNPASAVGVLLVDGEGRMLFIRRARDPGRGKLGLPGGFVDAGETGEEAARREVREEVGLEVGGLRYLTSYPNTYAYGEVVYDVVDFFYLTRVEDFSAVRCEDGEVGAWFLATPGEVRLEDFAFRSNWLAVEAFSRRALQAKGAQ